MNTVSVWSRCRCWRSRSGEAPGWGTQPLVTGLTTLGAAALPVCMGVAVLKYRLYELNRIISRVVSYTLITALLAGVFAGLRGVPARARLHVARARTGRRAGPAVLASGARQSPLSPHKPERSQ